VFGRGLPDASGLAAVRWARDYHLFILEPCPSPRLIWPSGPAAALAVLARPHITGMGSSYVMLLIAFYVDNGKEPAALERAASHCVLATAGSYRDSPYPPRFVVASAGASAGHSLVGRLSVTLISIF